MQNMKEYPTAQNLIKYLPEKLKHYRRNAKMSIDEASLLIKKSKGTISNWENGKGCPTFQDIIELCLAYNIELSDLITIKDTSVKPNAQEIDIILKFRNCYDIGKISVKRVLECSQKKAWK